jgi:hypothetical protein
MAIWNYRADLMPREWILKTYGCVPEVLDQEETVEEALDRDPDILDKEIPSPWEGIACPEDFLERAESILGVCERRDGHVCCGRRGSHRIDLWFKGGRPDLIGIKLDLRTPDIDLFERIVDYARHLDAMIVPDDRYTAVEPTLEGLLKDLPQSRAFRFCEDPAACLAAIAEKQRNRTNKP